MIRMTKGTYGLKVNGVVEAMTKHSAPFSLPADREAELVKAGVAVFVKETAEEKAHRNRKELQRIPAGIDSALHLDRNAGPQDHIQISVHYGDRKPADQLSQTPQHRCTRKSQQEVFHAKRYQHGEIDHPHPVLRLSHKSRQQTADQHRHTRRGSDKPQRHLASLR